MDIETWYTEIPYVTRIYLSTVFIITTCVSFGVLSPYYLLLDFSKILGFIFNEVVLSFAFSFCFIYIWCKRNPFENVQFIFGLIVPSGYLPWVLLAFSIITGGSIKNDLLGLAAGHIYIVLKDILPNSHGKAYLNTPRFLNPMRRVQNENEDANDNVFRPFRGRGVQIN